MTVATAPRPATAPDAATRRRVFSGIQPSGATTIGNYLGAIKRWVEQQHQHQSIHCIVNLHAMTVPYDPADLRQRTLDLAAVLLACGIDPEKAILFAQSEAPEHTELTWVLSTQTMFGELSRMTQFKDKGRGDDRVGSGLFFYPVLMAADILLYDTDSVPVGEDQRQHIELTRDIAMRFNATFGETFKLPAADIETEGARIMSLDDPTKKMSKSASPGSYIAFQDTADDIRRKINRAVTDSGSEIVAREDKPAMTNLLTIFSLFTGTPIPELERRFEGAGYGQLKQELGDAVVEHVAPIQARLAELRGDPGELIRILNRGAERAREIATPKMEQVRAATGLGLR
ncbi:MAG TPA: tryptophan--tRNA ligase [Thermomicrobiales bacterium]|nr:tryptophan--tRNA ligase [Thermomicrobiales bacterium]